VTTLGKLKNELSENPTKSITDIGFDNTLIYFMFSKIRD